MSVLPDGADLLATARATLLQELLPALPEAQRYAGLMIANAIGIAGRELGNPGFKEHLGAADLRELAQSIRAGTLDADRALSARLHALTVAKLRISNPRLLQGR